MDQEKLLKKKLLERLRSIGYILLFFGACALAWDFLPSIEVSVEENLQEEQEELSPLNPYLVAPVFLSIGILSILFARKKQHDAAS